MNKKINIGISIAGAANTSKGIIALKLMKLFEQNGLKDIKVLNLEAGGLLDPEQMIETQQGIDETALPQYDEATVFINLATLPREGNRLPGGVPDDRWKADYMLSAEQLAERYHGGEHPEFTRERWHHDIFALNEVMGYWEWAVRQLVISVTGREPEPKTEAPTQEAAEAPAAT
jgi:hypothetical protein